MTATKTKKKKLEGQHPKLRKALEAYEKLLKQKPISKYDQKVRFTLLSYFRALDYSYSVINSYPTSIPPFLGMFIYKLTEAIDDSVIAANTILATGKHTALTFDDLIKQEGKITNGQANFNDMP